MGCCLRPPPGGAADKTPTGLLERRRRAERALTTVVATCYLLGVSTRRMEKLVETLGITLLSKSQVAVMAKELDANVEDFRTRPLDQGLDVLADPARPPPHRPDHPRKGGPDTRSTHPPKVLPPDHVVTPSPTTTLDLTGR